MPFTYILPFIITLFGSIYIFSISLKEAEKSLHTAYKSKTFLYLSYMMFSVVCIMASLFFIFYGVLA